MSREHHDPAVLARALRAGAQLRDKVVVVTLDPTTLDDPQKVEPLAADLALARSLGIRMVTVCDPGTGPGPLDAQRPALRLVAALEKQGERGVALPAAGLVTVHRLPPTPTTPAILPVVNPILLIHLCLLGYIPILLLPVADTAGQVVDTQAGVIAAAVAQFMAAPLLVSLGVTPSGAAPSSPGSGPSSGPPHPGQPVTITAEPGHLLLDILLNAPPTAPLSAATVPQGVSLGDVKGILRT